MSSSCSFWRLYAGPACLMHCHIAATSACGETKALILCAGPCGNPIGRGPSQENCQKHVPVGCGQAWTAAAGSALDEHPQWCMRWHDLHSVWQVIHAFLLAAATSRCMCLSIQGVELLLVVHLQGEHNVSFAHLQNTPDLPIHQVSCLPAIFMAALF